MKRFLLSAIILLFPLAVLSCNKTPEGGDTPEEKVPAVPTGVRLHSATTTSLTLLITLHRSGSCQLLLSNSFASEPLLIGMVNGISALSRQQKKI